MNKKSTFSTLVLISTLLVLTACGKVLDFRNAEISNNKVYQSGANAPFTGKVTNFPIKSLPIEPLAKFAQIVMHDTVDEKNFSMTSAASSLVNGLGSDTVFCDLNFDDGIANGKVICKRPRSEITLLEINLKQGSIDGDAIFYHSVKDNEVIAKAKYKNGLIEGESIVNSFETGKIIHKIHWHDGRPDGTEEKFNKVSGALILRANSKNGNLDGDLIKYSEDGQIITTKASFSNGVQVGTFEEFDPKTGVLLRQSAWRNGVGTYTIVNSNDSTAAAISSDEKNKAEKCLDLWTMAYKKEVGEDVLITSDQISEWEASCKEGKKPD